MNMILHLMARGNTHLFRASPSAAFS